MPGGHYLVGCGVYNMQMEEHFIVDVVDRASALVETEGALAFQRLRDKSGPFVFMDTYIFVGRADGTEFVNPELPSLEGKNLIDVKDVKGQQFVRTYIESASEKAYLCAEGAVGRRHLHNWGWALPPIKMPSPGIA